MAATVKRAPQRAGLRLALKSVVHRSMEARSERRLRRGVAVAGDGGDDVVACVF